MIVGFFVYSFTIRGTEVAIYDYAHYNEILLDNKSKIFVLKDYKNKRHFDRTLTNNVEVEKKFRDRFEVIEINGISEIDNILLKEKVDIFYVLKSGENDGIYSKKVKSCIHCVFNDDDRHGDVYFPIYKRTKINEQVTNYVPHIVKEFV